MSTKTVKKQKLKPRLKSKLLPKIKQQGLKTEPKKLLPKRKPEAKSRNIRQRIHNRWVSQRNETLSDISVEDKQREDIIKWIPANRYIEDKPWSFETLGPLIDYGDQDVRSKVLLRPYLFQFLRDICIDRSVIKPRQSELTENHINEALYYIITRPHIRIAHIFPTDELGNDISAEKIGPAIRDSPEIFRRMLGVGSLKRYQFRNGSLYSVSGAMKKTGGRANTRDLIIFDEVDFMPDSIFGVFQSVMEHSKLRMVRKVSTPTVPLVGIDKIVRAGCEWEWFWKCWKCKKEQLFQWPDNLINFFESYDMDYDNPAYQKKINKVYFGCSHCKAYVDRNSAYYVKNSGWIAQRPHLANIRASYRIVAGMIAWKTGKDLLKQYHELSNYVWQFFNEKWGTAYLKKDNRLSEMEMMECQRQWKMAHVRTATMSAVSVGIDWGEKESWILVSCRGFDNQEKDIRCIVYVECINELSIRRHGLSGKPQAHVERAAQIIENFKADIIVNDAVGIGIDRAKTLLGKFPRRSYAGFFDTAEQGRQLRQTRMIVPQWNKSGHKVTFSKLTTIKECQNEFRTKRVGIPLIHGDDALILRQLIKQIMNMAIQPRWSQEMEREFEVYVKMGPDHLGDANLYSRIGWEHLVGFKSRIPGVAIKKQGD